MGGGGGDCGGGGGGGFPLGQVSGEGIPSSLYLFLGVFFCPLSTKDHVSSLHLLSWCHL